MSKTLMLYTSLTGNTETMAKEIINELKNRNIDVDVKKFDQHSINVKELSEYDVVYIGIYTWSAGDVPLDTEEFYDDLYDLDLNGKVCAVFGSADSAYEKFGTAVDLMYEQLEKLGATMIPDKIIADLDPTHEELERCKKLVESTFHLIKN